MTYCEKLENNSLTSSKSLLSYTELESVIILHYISKMVMMVKCWVKERFFEEINVVQIPCPTSYKKQCIIPIHGLYS